jgi:hypothetical protein
MHLGGLAGESRESYHQHELSTLRWFRANVSRICRREQVLDSPFSRLKDLMVELTEEQKLPIPRPFMRMALSMMKRSVKKRANFNIDDVSPLDVVGRSFIPALFGV